MSGYRAAPVGARVEYTAEGRTSPEVWVKQASGRWWALYVGALSYDALDALYWSRLDALESAAQACEQLGREAQDIGECIYSRGCRDAAAAIRKLKEQP